MCGELDNQAISDSIEAEEERENEEAEWFAI